MDTSANIDADLLGIGIGLFLAGEGLDMPLAVLGIVDDPGLFRFAALVFQLRLRTDMLRVLSGSCRY